MIVADFNLIIGLLKHFYSPQIILLFQPWPSSKEALILRMYKKLSRLSGV